MGRNPTKAKENVYFLCRKKAAITDERLSSREGAAELLGLSPSTLADYELGVTKYIPADSVVRMAALYKAPHLATRFCARECPIGARCGFELPQEEKPIEQIVLLMARNMQADRIETARNELIDIACDGRIDAEEKNRLNKIIDDLDGLLGGILSLQMAGASA